jgi:UDP-N-acetylglucosamine 3-dehydrogenase
MANRTINLGIIGYGYTGQQHARAISLTEGTVLRLVAEPDTAKRSLAKVPTVPDYQALLNNDLIQAVSICLPHDLHEEVTSAALAAGKHVLVEKPLARDVSTGKRLCELATGASRILMVEMTHRFLAPLLEAHALIGEGTIGEVLAVDEVLTEDIGLFGALPAWMFDLASAGGGVGLTSGIHLLDHISWILRAELNLNSACFGYKQELGTVEDTASFSLEAKNGIPVHVLTCWRKQGGGLDGQLAIIGSRGKLLVWPWNGIRLEKGNEVHEKRFFQEGKSIAERALTGITGAVQEFVSAIRQQRPPVPEPLESLRSQALIEQAYSRFGRPE